MGTGGWIALVILGLVYAPILLAYWAGYWD